MPDFFALGCCAGRGAPRAAESSAEGHSTEARHHYRKQSSAIYNEHKGWMLCAAQAAAPQGETNAVLKAAAIRLVNTLASSQHAASFQAAVTQLPQAAKQRLQVCVNLMSTCMTPESQCFLHKSASHSHARALGLEQPAASCCSCYHAEAADRASRLCCITR